MNTGLSHNSALCMSEDHDGFIWIGTRDGLNRFDGKNNIIYKHIFDDTTSISNNQINCLFEMGNNEFWMEQQMVCVPIFLILIIFQRLCYQIAMETRIPVISGPLKKQQIINFG